KFSRNPTDEIREESSPVISIRSEIDRDSFLQKTEQFKDLLAAHYAMAIRTVADYVVEVDSKLATEFRVHLRNLQTQAERASQPDHYAGLQASFRGELRSYRDDCADKLARMAAELGDAASVMQTMADHVSA